MTYDLCPGCGHPPPPHAVFCPACGNRLDGGCPGCGEHLPTGADSCPRCGESLPGGEDSPIPEGQRRQATVVFLDLQGYTRMVETVDAEEITVLMNRVKDGLTRVVESHAGIVNQYMGDGLMAVFGLPRAHDDDPARALSAALAALRFMGEYSGTDPGPPDLPLHLHAGIATGPVVTQLRDQRDGIYGVTGDAVNTAFRLLEAGESGEILVGPVTARLAEADIELEPVGPLALRGKAEPVSAFRVIGRRSRAPRRHPSRFVGREAELETLRLFLRRAEAGEGQVVVISGQPGIGKTRLLQRFGESLEGTGTRIIYGRCPSYGTVAPYTPFIQVLRTAAGLGEEDDPGPALERVVERLVGLGPEVEEHLPVLLYLLSVRSEDHPLSTEFRGEALRREILSSLGALLAALARRRPVVIVLEDWHWVDEASDLALQQLAPGLRRARIMVAVATRSGESISWTTPPSLSLDLRPLAEATTRKLAASALDVSSLPDGLVSFLQETTGGNPLFVEEVCRALVDDGTLRVSGDVADLAHPLGQVPVPETVQGVLRARLDNLDSEAGEVLRVASVVAPEFSTPLLQRLAPRPDRVPGVLERLQDADLIQPVSERDGDAYRFKHAIAQEVVYESVLHRQRAELHGRAGRAVEAMVEPGRVEERLEELAHHFSCSDDLDRALHYLERAGDKAADSFSLHQARRHYRQAIRILDRTASSDDAIRKRIDVSFKWAQASMQAPSAEQVEVLETSGRHAEALDDRSRLLRCHLWIGWIHHGLGNQMEAVRRFEACLEGAEAVDDPRLLAQIHLNIGQSLAAATEYDEALDHLERGLSQRRAIPGSGRSEGMAYALGYLGVVHADRGAFERAEEALGEAMEIVERLDRRSLEGSVLTEGAMIHFLRGDWERCARWAERIRRVGRQIGSTYIEAMADFYEGYARTAIGRDGLDLLRRGVTRLEAGEARITMSWSHGGFAEALARAGETTEAVLYAERALSRRSAHDRLGEPMAHRALGWAEIHSADPDPVVVQREIDEAFAVARRKGSRREEAVTRLHFGEILERLGRADSARCELRAARDAFADMGMAWYLKKAETLLGNRS